jgi:hypothetical protein
MWRARRGEWRRKEEERMKEDERRKEYEEDTEVEEMPVMEKKEEKILLPSAELVKFCLDEVLDTMDLTHPQHTLEEEQEILKKISRWPGAFTFSIGGFALQPENGSPRHR